MQNERFIEVVECLVDGQKMILVVTNQRLIILSDKLKENVFEF
jgi:hypothetical protein